MSPEEPAPAVQRLLARLSPVSAEAVPLADAAGRVLAEPVVADRPSPAADVTAMDGYAVRLADIPGELSIAAEVAIGEAPPQFVAGSAMRIFTGAPVPADADAVIKREDVTERDGSIVVPDGLAVESGQHLRRRGENLSEGETVVAAGVTIDATVSSALATFGVTEPAVHRKVAVGTIATGDEVLPPSSTPTPWQLRDSNTSAVATQFGGWSWVELAGADRRVDNKDLLTKSLGAMLDRCDAVVLSGGVSMGDYDFVPDAIAEVGGEIVFHRLRQRPGKPLLGAIGPDGQLILGLPGNPVSVMVTARRWGAMGLRTLAGLKEPDPAVTAVELVEPDGATIDLWWHRLVTITDGKAHLVPSMGSGDLVSAARSHGFVVIPPNEGGAGPWPYYPWTN